MDGEFHHDVTYLVAARAGFSPAEAAVIAASCQAVDENTIIRTVASGTPRAYANYVSQTGSPLHPNAGRLRLYPVFHFVPGYPQRPAARRRDGRSHVLDTVADSVLANRCFEEAAAAGSLYELGIACHAFADTWAHQGFVGYRHDYNGFPGLAVLIPSIGHADAGRAPDRVAEVWRDPRLAPPQPRIDNRVRFLEAAGRLYDRLVAARGDTPQPAVRRELLQHLAADFGATRPGPRRRGRRERRRRYACLALTPGYGGAPLPLFRLRDWWEAAAVECVDSDGAPAYQWRQPLCGHESHWFRFQESVKAYQRRTLAILTPVLALLPEPERRNLLMFA